MNNSKTSGNDIHLPETGSIETPYNQNEMSQTDISPVCTNKFAKTIGHHSDVESNILARKKLIIASVLCCLFMIAEIIGGLYANSLAVLADAAHLLSDLAGFMISIFAMWLASIELTSKNSKRHSFGFHRAEILGALLSVLIIWVMTIGLVYEAIDRFRHPPDVNGKLMFITACFGLVVNIAMGYTLHGHSHSLGEHEQHDELVSVQVGDPSHQDKNDMDVTDMDNKYDDQLDPSMDHETYRGESAHSHSHGKEQTHSSLLSTSQNPTYPTYGSNEEQQQLVDESSHDDHSHAHGGNINVRAAFIHVLGDAIQSAGVMFAAALIWYNPEWRMVDPICTFAFSAMVLFTTVSLMRNCIRILMEGVPENISLSDIEEGLKSISGVKEVHDLHVWSLTAGKPSLSVHVLVIPDDEIQTEEGERRDTARHVLEEAHKLCAAQFNIHHTTIQVEKQSCLGGYASK